MTQDRPLQERAFCDGEADAWYARNAAALGREDPVMRVLREFDRLEDMRSVADLGCSNGWRLAKLRDRLPPGAKLAGIDPSLAAIAAGRRLWPDLELQTGTLSAIPLRNPVDLAIVAFVFYLTDRAALAASVAEVDRLVRPGGVLLLADFVADEPVRVPYHHRTDVELFSYKQDHAAVFRALGYRETFRLEYDHDQPSLDRLVATRRVDAWGRCSVSVLVKAA